MFGYVWECLFLWRLEDCLKGPQEYCCARWWKPSSSASSIYPALLCTGDFFDWMQADAEATIIGMIYLISVHVSDVILCYSATVACCQPLCIIWSSSRALTLSS